MENNLVSRVKAAEILGVSKNTMINWEHSGKIAPTIITETGRHLYDRTELYNFRCEHPELHNINHSIAYCCCTNYTQAYLSDVTLYFIDKVLREKYVKEFYFDNLSSKYDIPVSLDKVLDKIKSGNVTELLLFGINALNPVIMRLLDEYCSKYNTELVTVDLYNLSWLDSYNLEKKCSGNIDEDLDEICDTLREYRYDSLVQEEEASELGIYSLMEIDEANANKLALELQDIFYKIMIDDLIKSKAILHTKDGDINCTEIDRDTLSDLIKSKFEGAILGYNEKEKDLERIRHGLE